ncbi:MAG: helix-turn-helix domain-containing protein [Gammaproteobacteria bacterium]|nr:helix-turn-helix domain-containing protein [Gammaproteobacteria bacterium]
MIIRKRRLQKGWSQQQLAEFSGLSVRTIQRIERGQRAGIESLKSLAAVFETDVAKLTEEIDMTTEPDTVGSETITQKEAEAIEYVRDIKGFYNHVIQYAAVMLLLLVINLFTSPGYMWVVWPALGWGIGVLIHGANVYEVFGFFGAGWEKRQIDKRMGRNE